MRAHPEIGRLPGWTAAGFRVCADPLANSTHRSLHQALDTAALALAAVAARLRAARPLLRERIEETQRRRIATDVPDLANVSRSEPHRHRRLIGTLHELEAFQHRRHGSPTPARADASGDRWREGDFAKQKYA